MTRPVTVAVGTIAVISTSNNAALTVPNFTAVFGKRTDIKDANDRFAVNVSPGLDDPSELATRRGEGRSQTEDIAMLWTEVANAPVVVLVIFFLFTLTGITGISPSETALSGNIGFAFIFDFASRRTLGLLDTIKKRIFPDPSS